MKALVHPTRIHIMDILSEGENSPSGIQRRIGDISLDLVSKHIKILRDLGVVELADEVKQKGKFTEHIYRATEWQFLTAEEWEAVDPDDRPSATTTILRVISEDVERAYFENKFDERIDNHLSRAPLKLDKEGWEEVVKTLEKALKAVLRAHDKSQERAGGA
ncbi:MAG TPA: helix-turn-helix domain-containing protein, partial [Solirubrobacterales bacterium]|nr:helix-turn-helix domain-containing protein [Solirubrobacterales bacterium]